MLLCHGIGEGETLEARVPFATGRCRSRSPSEVMEQAARALAAAERTALSIATSSRRRNDRVGAAVQPSLKVIDYGVAKITNLQGEPGINLTQSRFVGTPAFASPEQFAGAGQTPIDTRSGHATR